MADIRYGLPAAEKQDCSHPPMAYGKKFFQQPESNGVNANNKNKS
jgi:hypothetical protein